MKYVLDSSVALKIALPEIDSPKAIQFLDDFHNAIHDLIAPDVFHVEVGHASTRAERQGRISPPDAWRLWRTVMADCPVLFPTIPLMARAIALSSKARIGVWAMLLNPCGVFPPQSPVFNRRPVCRSSDRFASARLTGEPKPVVNDLQFLILQRTFAKLCD